MSWEKWWNDIAEKWKRNVDAIRKENSERLNKVLKNVRPKDRKIILQEIRKIKRQLTL